MKGLDTPVLLRLLRGEPAIRLVIRKLQGEELATTEWNMLELEILSQMDSSPGREIRRAALEKLRRRLTVLPIDERAVESFTRWRRGPRTVASPSVLAMVSALESRGCTEWLTDATTAGSVSGTRLRLQVVK